MHDKLVIQSAFSADSFLPSKIDSSLRAVCGSTWHYDQFIRLWTDLGWRTFHTLVVKLSASQHLPTLGLHALFQDIKAALSRSYSNSFFFLNSLGGRCSITVSCMPCGFMSTCTWLDSPDWSLLKTACTHAHNFLVWGWNSLIHVASMEMGVQHDSYKNFLHNTAHSIPTFKNWQQSPL